MTYSLAQLDGSFFADRSRSGLFLDFDGTLAPINPVPDAVRLSPNARDALAALAVSFGVVALVSGRGIGDLAERVGVAGLWLSGSHGMIVRAPNGTEQVIAVVSPDDERLASAGAAMKPLPTAIRVEHKPGAVAFHYRGHENDRALVAELTARADLAAEQLGLIAAPGRCLVEIRLPGIDKGAALRAIVEQANLTTVAVAGDDWTDLDAFRAAHRHLGHAVLTVAVRSAETPAPLLAEADAVADGVDDVIHWLERLAR